MPITVSVRKFQRSPFDVRRIRRELLAAQKRYAGAVEGMFMEVMDTWSGDHGQPSAAPQILSDFPSVVINIYARGEYAQIFTLLDQGYMRTVLMSDDFKAKTAPGVVGSRTGRGGPVRSKAGAYIRLPAPRPVVARHFVESITDIVRRGAIEYGTFEQYMSMALARSMPRRGPWRTYGGRRSYR